MARIFAYIVHRNGVAEDSAAELRQLQRGESTPTAALTAIVAGWGTDLDAVCESVRASYKKCGKSPMRLSPIPMPS